jgi:hypothetical protein
VRRDPAGLALRRRLDSTKPRAVQSLQDSRGRFTTRIRTGTADSSSSPARVATLGSVHSTAMVARNLPLSPRYRQSASPERVRADRDRDERLDRLSDDVIYFPVECTHDGGRPPLGRWAWVHATSKSDNPICLSARPLRGGTLHLALILTRNGDFFEKQMDRRRDGNGDQCSN